MWVLLPFLSSCWFIPLLHPVCCWTPLVYFSDKLLHSLALWLLFATFLGFLSLCWSSHCVHYLSLEFTKLLYDHYLEFFIRYIIHHCITKVFFWGFCFALSHVTCFSFTSFYLTLFLRIRQNSYLSVLKCPWKSAGPFFSLLPSLLVVSWTFVTV